MFANLFDGAFALKRGTSGTAHRDLPRALPADDTTPQPGADDEVSATPAAQVAALVLVLLGAGLAWAMKEDRPALKPLDGFVLLTGFYVAAQAIERLLELLPVGLGSKQAKANRAVVFPGFGFLIAVLAAEWLGLYYMHALGATDVSMDLDVIVTALAIGGGTKPLHDGIKRIEKAKETPPAGT